MPKIKIKTKIEQCTKIFIYRDLKPRFRKSLDPQISCLAGHFKKANAFLTNAIISHAFIKLFTRNGVYIKAYGKLKMA